MKSKTFLRIGSCLLVCLTGISFSFSFGSVPNSVVGSVDGDSDPTPLPPNPPPPPLGIGFGVSLL
jgi:hypothetical protein